MRRPKGYRANGDLHGAACALEFETDTGSESTPTEADRALKGEGEYGNSRTVECSLFQ